jgi:Zn-finger nucleic acid-binding protein
MKCPGCKAGAMEGVQLEDGLPAMVCPKCRGTFIRFDPYLAWVDQRGTVELAHSGGSQAAADVVAAAAAAADSGGAKLCPGCGRLMARFRVSADLPNALERCGGCAGFWLDGGEWEMLRRRDLHVRLNRIAGEVWQHKIRDQTLQAEQEQRYRTLLGEDAFARVREFKQWVGESGKEAIVMAYLQDRETP